jgi:hypothetical protein
MIASTFLFSSWEKRFNQEFYHQKSKISSNSSSSVSQIICNRSSTNELRFCRSIKFVYLEFDDAFNRTRTLICASKNIYSLFSSRSAFFFFILSIISRCCFCFSFIDFAWIFHDWQIWLQNTYFLEIALFDKRIFFLNSSIIIEIFQRLSSYLQQIVNSYET